MSRRFVILGFVVALLAVGWSSFWWFAASTADSASANAIARARDAGIAIDCTDREIGGFPFRLTLACRSLGVETAELKASSTGVRAVALVYDPKHLILEADAPLELAGAQLAGPVVADWQSGRASLLIGAQLLDEASVAFHDVAIRSDAFLPVRDPSAQRLELHVRRSQEAAADLDVALVSRAVAVFVGTVALPQFDLDVLARLTGGAGLLAGRHEAFVEQLKSGAAAVELQRALVTLGDALVEVSGVFSLTPEGYLEGQPRIAIANPAALGAALTAVPGVDAGWLAPFLGVLGNFGERTTIGDTPARAMTLTIRDGHLTAGLVPLGRLGPVVE